MLTRPQGESETGSRLAARIELSLYRSLDVHLVTPKEPNEIDTVLEKLFQQKSWSLARIGAADVVPGYRKFFRQLAASAVGRDFLHVSRLEVGDMWAPTNVGLSFRKQAALCEVRGAKLNVDK